MTTKPTYEELEQRVAVLQERTDFLDKIIESAALSTWISDEKGTAIRTNPACLAFFGAAEEEVIGKYNLFQDAVIEKQGFMPDIKRVFEKGEAVSILIDYDFGAVDHVDVKSATHKIVNSIFTPVLDNKGKVSNVIVQTIDLTDIKNAEAALRESEERLRIAGKAAYDLIYEWDVRNDSLEWFGDIDSLLGYEQGAISRDIDAWLELIHPEDRGQLENAVDLHRTATEPIHYDYRIRHVDGTYRQIQDHGLPMLDRQGRPYKWIGVCTDITERKWAEAERETLQRQLAQSQKMEAIGTLSGGIAHDFNNILGIILGNTELAIDDVPEWNPAHKNLEEVRKACLRAKDVIRQILSFSRQTETKMEPFHAVPLMEESIKLLRASIPTSIEIRQHVSSDLDTILGDATQIHQVLINLCTNAAHAMAEKGGMLDVELSDHLLDEREASQYPGVSPGPHLRLVVKDTGHGIAPETLARIFEPYFTTKDVDQGTGMGLAVVHGIVKRHGGIIRAESQPGKGSSFVVLFPVVEETSPDVPKKTGEMPKGDERILFVDDEKLMVELSRSRLERLGYTVDSHTDPTEALTVFRSNSHTFDLVITDMTMPRMNGDRLAQEILAIRSDMPIILCTGYSQKMTAEKAQKLGIRKYIEKPIEMVNLARSVREVLDGK